MKKTIVTLIAATTLMGCVLRGNGEKIGMITKIAKQGVFCPTWEAEIVRGGFSGGSGVNGQAFHFTIENDAQAEEIRKAMEEQREVKIHYRSEFATFCRSDSGNDFLTKLEIVERKANATGPKDEATTGNSDDVVLRLLEVQAQLIAELAKRKDSK